MYGAIRAKLGNSMDGGRDAIAVVPAANRSRSKFAAKLPCDTYRCQHRYGRTYVGPGRAVPKLHAYVSGCPRPSNRYREPDHHARCPGVRPPAFAGEGKGSGCASDRGGRATGKAERPRMAATRTTEPKSGGRISVTKLLLDYPARFLLTGGNKSSPCQF